MTTCNDCNGRREYWTEWGDAARRDPSLQHLVIEVDEDEPYALIHCQCAVPPAAGAAAPDPQPWPAPTGEPYTFSVDDTCSHVGYFTDASIVGMHPDQDGVSVTSMPIMLAPIPPTGPAYMWAVATRYYFPDDRPTTIVRYLTDAEVQSMEFGESDVLHFIAIPWSYATCGFCHLVNTECDCPF